MSPYLCITEALEFRGRLGGEAQVQQYCFGLARRGGKLMAEVLNTEVMDNKSSTLSECCFAMVRLPVQFVSQQQPRSETARDGVFDTKDGPKIVKWIMTTLKDKHNTWKPANFYCGAIWVRVSAQVYLDIQDFEWAARVLKELCRQAQDGRSLHL